MNNKVLIVIGGVLMAGCGAVLSYQLGLSVVNTALCAGFALGVVLLGQAPTLLLRDKVESLERNVPRANGQQ